MRDICAGLAELRQDFFVAGSAQRVIGRGTCKRSAAERKLLTSHLLSAVGNAVCVAFPQQFSDSRSWETVAFCEWWSETVFNFVNRLLNGMSVFLNNRQRHIDFFEVFHRLLKYMQRPADS